VSSQTSLCFCEPEDIVVIIDPGHGGDNGGANYDGIDEKYLTLKLAKEVNKILSNYDGIKVIMTREDDQSVSLAQRAEIGKENSADILISMHFNASLEKNIYGSEIFTSGEGKYYSRGMDIGKYFIDNLKALGFVSRGVKTRMSDDGNIDDYYGIIRESVSRGFPAIIVEHCFLDFEKQFSSDDKISDFAKADADAIIKYFNLGTEKSGMPELVTPIPNEFVRDDTTPPDEVRLNVTKNPDNKYVFNFFAKDKDSPIIYFDYSVDGGKNWTPLNTWKGDNNGNYQYIFEGKITDSVIFKAYNSYDLYSESNMVSLSEAEASANNGGAASQDIETAENQSTNTSYIYIIAFAVIIIAIAGALITLNLKNIKNRKNK